MLRVGLTGDLGSGKSTVAQMLAQRGAIVLSSDDIGRALMQPGERVYDEIVAAFGDGIVAPDGFIDRRKLAALAFHPVQPRVDELNWIVHPAVIAVQARQLDELGRTKPHAIAVVESALIFSTRQTSETDWRSRFDHILLVEAPESQKIARFADRVADGKILSPEVRLEIEADARRRLAVQHETPYSADCMVLHNDSAIDQLAVQVDAAWEKLQQIVGKRLT